MAIQIEHLYNDRIDLVLHTSLILLQMSILGPLLFIIYTNDLPNCLKFSKAILFADDTTVYLTSKNIPNLFNNINSDLDLLAEWFRANKLSLNIEKTNYVVFKQNPTEIDEHLKIKIGNNTIEQKYVIQFLGLYIGAQIKWHDHINDITK